MFSKSEFRGAALAALWGVTAWETPEPWRNALIGAALLLFALFICYGERRLH